MTIEPKKVGGWYIYDNPEAKENAINVILIASVHGNEPYASIIVHKFMGYLKFNHFYENVKQLVIYPFANKSGIRARQRLQQNFSSNLNDGWLTPDYRASIKELIDSRCSVEGSRTVVIDIHNSPWIEPCFLLEARDNNCDHIEHALQVFNKSCGVNNGVDVIKRHTDIETIKSYVNTCYNKTAIGLTLEIGMMSQALAHKNYTIHCADKIDHFIRFISGSFDIYFDELPEDFEPCDLCRTLTANSSGILIYTIDFDEHAYAGDTIAKIMDLDSYTCIDEVKAPFSGKFIDKINEFYVNAGEVIGIFMPEDDD